MSDATKMVARLRTEKPTGPLMVAAAALIEREAARLAVAERLLREARAWLDVSHKATRDLDARIDAFLGATDSAPAATELLPLHCVHGKRVYERCEQCETSATGFTRAASTAPAAPLCPYCGMPDCGYTGGECVAETVDGVKELT